MSATSPRIIRYAIYTRQSVDRGDSFSSCDVQFITCRAAAIASGRPELQWVDQHFDDVGYSGATLERPALQAFRQMIAEGGIKRLFAVALDRLSRNMRQAVVPSVSQLMFRCQVPGFTAGARGLQHSASTGWACITARVVV